MIDIQRSASFGQRYFVVLWRWRWKLSWVAECVL